MVTADDLGRAVRDHLSELAHENEAGGSATPTAAVRPACGRAPRPAPGGRAGPACFLQAEDGIRDVAVTGVQTCALPISDRKTDHAASTTVMMIEIAAVMRIDRKSVVEGKRVDLGGRRIIKKKRNTGGAVLARGLWGGVAGGGGGLRACE